MCRSPPSPPPPPAERVFQAWRGISEFGFPAPPPFSQILDPPLVNEGSSISEVTEKLFSSALHQKMRLLMCFIF